MALTGCLSARTVLWHLTFWGFAVNYMMRINLSIAIVAMVETRRSDVSLKVKESECFVAVHLNTTLADNNTIALTHRDSQLVFPWDEYQQGLILGAFYWFNWVLQLPGGILARKYGTKIVFGLGNVLMCVLSVLIPSASYLDYRALIVLRCLQGLIGGVCWPSMHNMVATWIPPNERSKFLTAYLGSSVGAALAFPLCGLIIDKYGWPPAFYITGVVGIAWFIAWWSLVYDSPAQHPYIDPKERQFIEDSLGRTVLKDKPPVPWKHLLTSGPVWFTIVAQIGGIWSLFTILAQAPTYFKFIHGWDVRMAGLLSGIPHLSRVLFALVFSTVADGLLKRNAVSRVTVRKFATVVCTIGQGLFILGLAFCDCNWLAAVVCATLAISLHGAVSAGPLAVFVDISPNYAGVTFGFAGVIAVMPGFISPAVVAELTYQNQTIGQWQIVFLITAAILFVSGTVFLFCATPTVQPWNDPENLDKEMEKKCKTLMVDEADPKDAVVNGEVTEVRLTLAREKTEDRDST